VQNRYSFADREWDYVVDYCERNGIAFIPWFPLGRAELRATCWSDCACAPSHTHAGSDSVAAAESPHMLPIPGLRRSTSRENVAAASLR